MDIETLTKKIFDECRKDGEPVTLEQAREMAELEIKAEKSIDHGVVMEKAKAKKRKPRKVDIPKQKLLNYFKEMLEEKGATDFHIQTETELSFYFEFDNYTIKLIRHRLPKKGE